MTKSIQELNELKLKAYNAMKNIQETKGEAMDESSMSVVRSLKEEVKGYDLAIEAQELTRSIAFNNSKPIEEKIVDNTNEQRNLFNKYLRGLIDKKDYNTELRTMNVGTPTAGGSTVPDEFIKTLLEKTLEQGTFSKDVSILKTNENGEITIPTIDDTMNAAEFIAEGGQYTETDATTGSITINDYKLGSAIRLSKELAQDSGVNIQGKVIEFLSKRLSRAVEAWSLLGTGTNMALGVLVDSKTKTHLTATVGDLTIQDVKDAIRKLSPSQRVGIKIYASDEAIAKFEDEVDGNGRPLLQTASNASQTSVVSYVISGVPIVANYDLATVVTGNNPVLIGNPSLYTIRSVQDAEISVSHEIGFLTDEVVYKISARIDGKIISENDSFVKIEIA